MTLAEAIKNMDLSECKTANKPIYVHDCKSCIFIGQLYGIMADVWFCPNSYQLIVRDGNEGWEYSSLRSGFNYEGIEIPEITKPKNKPACEPAPCSDCICGFVS